MSDVVIMMEDEKKQLDAVDRRGDKPLGEGLAAAAESGTSQEQAFLARAIRNVVIQQAAALVIATLVLDGGDLFRLVFAAALLSWVPIVAIVLRQAANRANTPTRADVAIAKHGFWVFFVGMYLLYACHLLPSRSYFVNRVKTHRPPASGQQDVISDDAGADRHANVPTFN